MKTRLYILMILMPVAGLAQDFDTADYKITVDTSSAPDHFFSRDPLWRGADGAASVDMGHGKVLWLFSDSFIATDSPFSRKKSVLVRNSIAIQEGYDPKTASIKFYWNKTGKKPGAFFESEGKEWCWTGHGTMVKDRLLIFLIREKQTKQGLGFEATGWAAVLINNPADDPSSWKMKYIKAPETFGLIAGSAAVLKDEHYIYAYGAVEPSSHEVYVLRWPLDSAYKGNLSKPQWWINNSWIKRTKRLPIPEPLFYGQTEFSVHYDSSLKKYLQFQSFGFGMGSIGVRMADSLQGPWSGLHIFARPRPVAVINPFMYSVKAHPELHTDGIYLTYNVNSFGFDDLLNNQTIYFPFFMRVKINRR